MRKLTVKRVTILACGVLLFILILTSIIMIPKMHKELIISGDRNIFFIETSHINKEMIILTPRQCCAVESAARMNPSLNIYLLIVSSQSTYFSDDTKNIIPYLSYYKNIHIQQISLGNYIQETPMEILRNKTREATSSHWFILRMSTVLKYLTLWKYGGIYLDLDVVVRSSLENLKNFVGVESYKSIGAGVIGFDSSNIGRQYAYMCLRKAIRDFEKDDWSFVKPSVITRFVRKICDTAYYDDLVTIVCNNYTLTVFKQSTFYPIPPGEWKQYFHCDEKNKTKIMIAINRAMAIHVWNEHSYSESLEIGSNAPYALTASEFCPAVYHNSDQFF